MVEELNRPQSHGRTHVGGFSSQAPQWTFGEYRNKLPPSTCFFKCFCSCMALATRQPEQMTGRQAPSLLPPATFSVADWAGSQPVSPGCLSKVLQEPQVRDSTKQHCNDDHRECGGLIRSAGGQAPAGRAAQREPLQVSRQMDGGAMPCAPAACAGRLRPLSPLPTFQHGCCLTNSRTRHKRAR